MYREIKSQREAQKVEVEEQTAGFFESEYIAREMYVKYRLIECISS